MNEVCQTARKWYRLIPFSKEYDLEFERILEENSDLAPMKLSEYDLKDNIENIEKNLVMVLYFCEGASKVYTQMGIPQEIFIDTIKDFALIAERCVSLHGKFGFYRLSGLVQYLDLKIFRLGRLVFEIGGAYMDVDEMGIKKGDNIIDIHVPGGEPLIIEECLNSMRMAEAFFGKYFPSYRFEYFTCFSWLLDDGLSRFLNSGSNILAFQRLFDVVYKRKEDSILHFMFRYGIGSREELRMCKAESAFAKKIKEYALSGGDFYNVLGVRKRENAI